MACDFGAEGAAGAGVSGVSLSMALVMIAGGPQSCRYFHIVVLQTCQGVVTSLWALPP